MLRNLGKLILKNLNDYIQTLKNLRIYPYQKE